MSDVVLFIFEGRKTEPRILDNFKENFFEKGSDFMYYATYNTNIYQLYNEVKEDIFLDLIEILKEKDEGNDKRLKNISREDVAQIYLFFDYDGHAEIAKDNKIDEMLEFFNEETDRGKLYISYPMVEALKHIKKEHRCYDICSIRKDRFIGY